MSRSSNLDKSKSTYKTLRTSLAKIINKLNMKSSFWPDSIIVLQCIKNNFSKLKMFFKNRVHEIKKMSDPDCWKDFIGNKNSADTLTQDENLTSLKDQEL